MAKMSSFEVTATSTSANATTFAFSDIPDKQINAKAVYVLVTLPAVSAEDCSATIRLVDVDNNTLWASVTNGFAEGAAASSGVTFYIGGTTGEHFHLVWAARPSGDDNLPGGSSGADVNATLKVWVENYTN